MILSGKDALVLWSSLTLFTIVCFEMDLVRVRYVAEYTTVRTIVLVMVTWTIGHTHPSL